MFAFTHLFSPWQNESKLSFAHLAERKGSLVLIYHRQALSYGEHSLLCTTYLPHGMQGDNGNRVVHHKAKQALLHNYETFYVGTTQRVC